MKKIFAGSLAILSLLSLSSVPAKAEWIEERAGCRYSEGNSCAVGWREIDGARYFFNNNGYMATDTVIDGYYLNSGGVGIECVTKEGLIIEKSTGIVMKLIRRDTKCKPKLDKISIVIPQEVDGVEIKGIGNRAFGTCTNIENIVIPETVTSIGGRAFYGCMSIENITIPNSVTSIGESAFCECSNLKKVVIPDSVTTIGESAFSKCNKAVFYVQSEKTKQLLINSKIDSSKIIVTNNIDSNSK